MTGSGLEGNMQRKVLITGSTQGIGLATAKRLIEDGYEVIVHCSRDEKKAEGIAREIGAAGFSVADLSDRQETLELHEKTGDVDVLILNASVQYKEGWQEIGLEEMDRQITVNLKSTLLLMQAYYPYMQARKWGRIVTVGSVNQYRQHPELSLYAATKCAVASLVKNIAREAAPFGVTVNNVVPGAIATPRNAAVYDDCRARATVEASIPLGRFGTPEECADAVAFLVGESGKYITGTDLVIDGGMRL